MHLIVHVQQRAIAVNVGDGGQPVKWLANVGMARYDEAQGRSLGQPVGIRLEDGSTLGLTQTLVDAGLQHQQHVWVVFRGHRTEGVKPKGGAVAADEEED